MSTMKNENIHLLLVSLLVIVIILELVLIFGNSSMFGQKTGSNSISYLTTHASGTASAQPVTGVLYLTVKGMGRTTYAATLNLTSSLAQVNSTLSKYINGNLSNVQTTYYNVYNQTSYYYPVPAGTYNGTIAEEGLTVNIPNIKNLSGAIGGLSLINNTLVTSASASLSDEQTTALRAQAFSNAIKNATTQAEILTGNASLTTQNITVNSYFFYPIPYAVGTANSGSLSGSTAVNPAFYSGTDSVTESITVVFSYAR